jgi:hypothetical protein
MARITLKGHPVNTAGSLPSNGTIAPEIGKEPDYYAALNALKKSWSIV